jgi:hypothetical protein
MRRQLAGPGTNKHDPKKDIGLQAPAAHNTGGYRATSTAAGPTSSTGEYNPKKDIGVSLPCSGGGGKEYLG